MFRKVNKELDNYYKINNELFTKYVVIKLSRRREMIDKMCLACKEKHCKGECYKIRKLRREQGNAK